MTTTIDDYLGRLDAALATVPYGTAREIRDGVEEELRSLDGPAADERMRALGSPEEIAAAAAGTLHEQPAPSWGAPAPERPSGTASPVYVVLTGLAVAIGFWVVPIVGWIAGLVLLWSSVVWRRWEKILATAVPLAALALLVATTAIVDLVREQQRTAAYRSELTSSEFPGAGNPFVPASYDLLWSAPLAIGLLNLAVGVWLLVVAFRRGLAPVSPGRVAASGPDLGRSATGGSALTAIATSMLVVGVLGGLGMLMVFARPIMAAPLLLLAIAGLVMLVVRAVSRR